MTARVLIVDDIPTNIRLLEVRLTAEYFEVVTATSGQQALEICQTQDIDIVLLDVMMPEMDGFEVCRRLKADPRTHHVPVLMVTALDQPSDRVKGLEVGADDFLTKPVDDMQLMARVKSLIRLKSLTDELRARALTGQQIAIEDALRAMDQISASGGSVLIIDTDARHADRIKGHLAPEHQVDVLTQPADAVFQVSGASYELALVSMSLTDFDPLRVCSQIRTLEHARNLPIILMADEADKPRVVRALDLGVNDFISRPVERNELAARVRTQIRRYRYAMELRESVNHTMALAVTDELTGLYNRRYFDRHLNVMLGKAQAQERDMALMILDIDYFKSVNDNYGHDIGDAVLREFSARLKRNIRGVDLACRVGGEEFVVLMPDTDWSNAEVVAERVRQAIAERPFDVGLPRPLSITVSVGVSLNESLTDTPEMLIKRADVALYRAKREGRNRVIFDAA
ncbi:PleD family two-component system response regulator [Devosia sp. 63-57]|uniref:PleD family two-component system response regulator n=1 Tax=Devosia sp. 63-57 TaxID=1895751 RepID=UPI000869A775|nr:PleD family two-component system response regulator [Devosia sp. 63-57]ODT49287.1 MAG: PleD family two-component system response regulator [Pelagibacterium sp. SCN 63-126]ODU82243.1 MAG: PleD family two-component system response regulator [Pelagibacterium sp. SCN 63-17]OJX43410.1 MAG: PleD family two-component system response regulator [Devosia sp. 63-57]